MKKKTALYDHPDLDRLLEDLRGENNDGSDKSKKSGKGETSIIPAPKSSFGYSLICLFAVTVLAILYVVAINLNTSSMTISMTFSEIAKGCNPDGSPFDIYELMSEEVLSRACEKLDGKVDVETLTKHISVTGMTSDGSFNAIEKNVLDGNDTYSYFPSRYTLSYSVVSDAVKSEGRLAPFRAVAVQFGLPAKETVLQAVADSYKEYYEDKYILSDSFFEIDWTKTRSLDHFNRVTEMSNILNRLSRFLSARYDEDVRYVTAEKISFGDLNSEALRISENDIEAYKAYIIQRGVTNDRSRLLKQLEYVKNAHEEQYSRSIGEYNSAMNGLALYDPQVTKVVFIPALDSENKFYMNRTKIGIDYLTEYADRARLAGNQEENSAHYYRYLLEQFGSADDNEEALRAAEEKSEAIIGKISTLSENAREVNREYIRDNSYEEVYISPVSRGHGLVASAVAVIKNIILFGCALYAIGWFISLLRYVKKRADRGFEDADESEEEEGTGNVGE